MWFGGTALLLGRVVDFLRSNHSIFILPLAKDSGHLEMVPNLVQQCQANEHAVTKDNEIPLDVAKQEKTEIQRKSPLVGVIMGNSNDLPTMHAMVDILHHFCIPYEVDDIVSAHHTPDK
jgi:hypothetical protein